MQSKSATARWGSFMTGLLAIWLFMFVVAPWFKRFESVNMLTTYVEDTGINASGIYWSDVAATGDAEIGARTTLQFTPRGPIAQ